MSLIRRVMYRARVLTGQWLHRNAFLFGLVFGSAVTTLVLLIH
jgi:hypothetical protein